MLATAHAGGGGRLLHLLRLPLLALLAAGVALARYLGWSTSLVVALVVAALAVVLMWYWERRKHHRGDHRELATDRRGPTLHHHHEPGVDRPYHRLETEADQVAFLRAAGFVRVDCFYKRLLQTVIGGYKPS